MKMKPPSGPKKTNPNKPNFRILPKVSGKLLLLIKFPGLICLWVSQSKPNSNPIKPNLPEGKIDAKYVFTKDYEEKCG